jgi:AmmeMemoRadiSam system protein B
MAFFSESRPSPIAGLWYSNDSSKLAEEIDRYIENARIPELNGEVRCVLAPHAGYRYSGATAGYAFKTVFGKNFDQVIILSPYHAYHPQSLLSSAHRAYETPLGSVSVNQDFLKELNDRLYEEHGIKILEIANDQEHSLEIEIPFLQRTLSKPFDLIPLMVRSIDLLTANNIANVLTKMIKNKNWLIVISTDLSHFYNQEQAVKFDQTMLNSIASCSPEKVFQTERNGEGFACGLGAVLTGMVTSKMMGYDNVTILHQSTSGDITGDYQSVVGYGAAVFTKPSNLVDS